MTEFDDNYVPEDIEAGETVILCPICGTRTENNPEEVLFEIEHIDSDFRVHTQRDDILDDWLIMCPKCYYVSHDFMQQPLKLTEIRAFILSKNYTNLFQDNSPTTIELFNIYLILITLQEQDSYVKADCHLRLAWLYEDDENSVKTNIHRNKAIEYYEKSLNEKNLSTKDTGIIYYMIADIYRRMSMFSKAKNFLYNLDKSEKTIKNLYEFEMALIKSGNSGQVILPREEVDEN